VIVIRHPLNILASVLELEMADADRRLDTHPQVVDQLLEPNAISPPPQEAGHLERAAWHIGLLTFELAETVKRNPNWVLVRHEDLCDEPLSRFNSLCSQLQLGWNSSIADFLRQSNRPGTGMQVQRISKSQPDRWKTRLSQDQQQAATAILRQFPVSGLYEELGPASKGDEHQRS